MVSHNFDWNIRKEGSDYDPLTQYDGHPELVFFEIHHGRCFTPTPNRSYVGGHVSYVDVVNIDEFCLHDLKEMVVKLGYGVAGLMYYHFLRPRLSLDYGLHLLTVDADVLELATYIKDNKIILVYVEHGKETPTVEENNPFDDLDEILKGVGPMGNFKEVKVGRENETEEESDESEIEENNATSSKMRHALPFT
ncbi:hypothetical protein Tco_1299196 [Tanacetum coccineum]